MTKATSFPIKIRQTNGKQVGRILKPAIIVTSPSDLVPESYRNYGQEEGLSET